MKVVQVQDLQGGEYLAKPVMLENKQMLYYEGTCLHAMHIDKVKGYGIDEVCIFEPEIFINKPKEIIKEEVHRDCRNKIRFILENHICKNDAGLEKISETAEEIIADIFSKEEVVEKVYDIKERDADIYDHSINVSALSILTALKMNLSQNLVYNIGVGSLLHDLGLKYISIDYCNVNIESFSPDNLFEFKKHTVYGFSSVEKENWMSSISKKIILFHHERLNGTGYPLKQKNIPIEIRIVSVCDSFDDKICGIGCEQIKVQEAIEYLKSYKDIYFDGKVVDIFLNFVAEYPVGSLVLTNDGEEAIVIEQNEHFTDRPIIRMIKDKNGNIYNKERIINLVEVQDLYIEKVIN
ncbi:MAG: HD domain-containing protein [Lachnospiraceae bacterium]